MSWDWFKDILGAKRSGPLGLSMQGEGYVPPTQDTLAAIGELSRVVKNNPDAVEIYLALGNLYRSQGEIERAVQIRSNLIVRPGLAPEFKAKALYELGRDFRRAGFMDRALTALEEARKVAGNDPVIIAELARLASDTADYKQAAESYAQLGHNQAVAHYQVRLAREHLAAGQTGPARKLLKKAIDAYPASVEAWIEFLLLDVKNHDKEKLAEHLEAAMDAVKPEIRFLLLEMVLSSVSEPGSPEAVSGSAAALACEPELITSILPLIEKRDPDLLLYYYGARLLIKCGEYEEGRTWLEKTLLIGPEFWPARLELLALIMKEQELSPELATQLEFFAARAREVKRFVCNACGLKREQIFFVCPRCQSWHSIRFRINLTE